MRSISSFPLRLILVKGIHRSIMTESQSLFSAGRLTVIKHDLSVIFVSSCGEVIRN